VKLEDLEELREQLDQTESSLSRERSLKQNLLDQTRGVEKNYQKLLSQSKNEEDKIEQEIQDLDNAIRAKLGNRTIAATKGDLAWPMTGIKILQAPYPVGKKFLLGIW
jgi:DNA repair exonuclease SbcCD ATPase subunit